MPVGKLYEFDINGTRSWNAYIRLVEQFIKLNTIPAELRVATLVTHVGGATYDLMCDLCAPDYPENKSFDDLVALVKNHLEPKRSEISERHIFRQRRQADNESIGTFLQSLKHLSTHCNFGSKLEENLRDQFVSGLRSEDMRSRLFAEATLDYKRAVELALGLEAAGQNAVKAASAPLTAIAGTSSDGAPGSGGLMQGAAAGLHRVGGPAPRHQRRSACWRCGKDNHAPNKCRFKAYTCNKCNVKGHLASTCSKISKSVSVGQSKSQNYIDDSDSESDDSDGLYKILTAKKNGKDGPYHCELKVENIIISFEVDTGSRISAVSNKFYEQYFKHLPIIQDNIKLQSYTGDAINPRGRITVRVSSESETVDLPLFIIINGGPPLLGRVWLRKLKLNSINLNQISSDNEQLIITLKNEFPNVFKDGIGTFKTKINLYLKEKQPIFCKARPLPLALRDPVERELERLRSENIIYKVERSDYGTPIVPIIKRDGSIRICGDYKITVNKQLKDFHYPLPRIEQLFAALSGGEQFTKLDLKNAYLQLLLSEASQPLTAITTHIGIFVYRRAPFGIKCLPEIFQKLIEETLCGIDGVVCFIDDICITGKTRQIHLRNLRLVLAKLRDAGLRIKIEKCEFFRNEVCYLGYKINKYGVQTDENKVAAIVNLPTPQNVTQLRAALGLINYYSRFIKNISTTLNPLYALLAKGARWQWSKACEEAFVRIKEQLVDGGVLAHYDPQLPLVLAVDSSSHGLGAVLSHVYPDGSERIVCCASRTLNQAERRYSQIDKEALAIVYGVNRHHQYLFGRKFTLRSDHKALTYIFGPKHGIPQTAASRLQRYAIRLAAYNFDIVFVSTDKNGNADGLSRLPLETDKSSNEEEEDAAYLHFVEENFPLSHREVAKETKKDVILCKIFAYIMSGWPAESEVDNEKPYFYRKDSLHIDHGCIVWGYRVVIPNTLRKQIIEEIHVGHIGIVRMKQIARNYVWWPMIDSDIETRARVCDACRSERDAPPAAAPVPYSWPSEPWVRLHVDFLIYKGIYYFLIIDSHSKWIEVFTMSSGTSARLVIGKLRELFARFGLPKQIVTDGGPPFTSIEFENFLKMNGVVHILTAPYHPSSNGAAENGVRTIKKVIKKASVEGQNIDLALNKFLLQYRNSAHCSTQVEPAVALLGHRLRTRLDMLRAPGTAQHMEAVQRAQTERAGGTTRTLTPGDSVLVRNYSKYGPKWKEGVINERTGSVTYKVTSGNNDASEKHIDQIMLNKKPTRFSWSLPSETDNHHRSVTITNSEVNVAGTDHNYPIMQPRPRSLSESSALSPDKTNSPGSIAASSLATIPADIAATAPPPPAPLLAPVTAPTTSDNNAQATPIRKRNLRPLKHRM